MNEKGVVVPNKGRLVPKGCSQKEENCYDETFDPVAMLEAISLLFEFIIFMEIKC